MNYIKKITIKTYPSNIEVYDDNYNNNYPSLGRIYTRGSDEGKAYNKYVYEAINDSLKQDGYRISKRLVKEICYQFNRLILKNY